MFFWKTKTAFNSYIHFNPIRVLGFFILLTVGSLRDVKSGGECEERYINKSKSESVITNFYRFNLNKMCDMTQQTSTRKIVNKICHKF